MNYPAYTNFKSVNIRVAQDLNYMNSVLSKSLESGPKSHEQYLADNFDEMISFCKEAADRLNRFEKWIRTERDRMFSDRSERKGNKEI